MVKGVTIMFHLPATIDGTELEAHVVAQSLQQRIERIVYAEASIDVVPAGRVVHFTTEEAWSASIEALRDEQ